MPSKGLKKCMPHYIGARFICLFCRDGEHDDKGKYHTDKRKVSSVQMTPFVIMMEVADHQCRVNIDADDIAQRRVMQMNGFSIDWLSIFSEMTQGETGAMN